MRLAAATLLALALSGAAQAQTPAAPADAVYATAAKLRDRAMQGSEAYAFVEALTVETGPRLAATEGEARARDWAVARLRAMGFRNVRVEPFDMPRFDRGVEAAAIVSPFPQPLVVTALGRSGATQPQGLTAEVVRFATLDDLRAAPAGSLTGRIAYVTHAMVRSQDGSSYGAAGAVRRLGPSIAASKGAAAIVIRSLGTNPERRNPHTGSNTWEAGQSPIPAAALSLIDADQLDRIFVHAGGRPVTMRLTLTPRMTARATSGNVIAEIPGSDRANEIVLIGGHLDSWDLATGAIDDGAGCAITVAAAKLIMDSGLKPRRTIRVVLFGAEEPGIVGGRAYAAAHKAERHVLAAESDFGAGRIYQLASRVRAEALPVIAGMARVLGPIGVAPTRNNDDRGGPDLVQLAADGVPTLALDQDGYDYFDYHHTPDDTLDKIDAKALDQNVAAYAAAAWIAANTDVSFGPVGEGK